MSADARLEIVLQVTRGSETATAYRTVTIGEGAGGEFLVGGSGKAGSSASAAAQSFATAASVPPEYALDGVSPNPFGSTTTVRFALPERSDVRVVVLDLLGREVARLADDAREAGRHAVRFDGSGLPGGVYLVRMEARGASGAFAHTEPVTLAR